jgi:hypothetical protein
MDQMSDEIGMEEILAKASSTLLPTSMLDITPDPKWKEESENDDDMMKEEDERIGIQRCINKYKMQRTRKRLLH